MAACSVCLQMASKNFYQKILDDCATVVGFEYVTPPVLMKLFTAVESDVTNMTKDQVAHLLDDYEESKDRVYLKKVHNIIDRKAACFDCHDEVVYDAIRQCAIIMFKHFVAARTSSGRVMTSKLEEKILKRNGDLYIGLTRKERKKIDTILRKYEAERVWLASSHFDFFVAKFGCTPREFLHRK